MRPRWLPFFCLALLVGAHPSAAQTLTPTAPPIEAPMATPAATPLEPAADHEAPFARLLPHLVTDLLRRDWASKLRHQLSVPVLHVIGGTDEVIN